MKTLCLPEGCPETSPWGKVQHGEKLAEGVYTVSTASHGGIKCDRKANARIPAIFRAPGGWYEEDCEWSIPVIFLGILPDSLTSAHKILLNDRWQEYEQYFHVVLAPGESYSKDQFIFQTKNAGAWLVTCAWGDWHAKVPTGMVGCYAVRNNDRDNPRYYLVPQKEYDTRGNFSFVIDEAKHQVWEGPH